MDDVEDYLRARWNDLVRTLICLGSGIDDAEATAVAALAGCRGQVKAELRDGDADVLLYAALLASHGEADAAHAGRVLRTGVGLEEFQVEQVLGSTAPATDGHPGGPPVPYGPDWDDLYRGLLPVAEIDAVIARRRRRRLLAAAAVVAVLALVAGVLWLTRSDDPPRPPPPQPVANPVARAWWADGRLHLGEKVLDVPGVTALAQVGSGTDYRAVYVDRSGQVVQVEPDGTRVRIGHAQPRAPVIGSADDLVAWVDHRSSSTTLVEWNAASRTINGRLSLDDPTARALALDGETVWFSDRRFAWQWTPGQSAAFPESGRLLAVSDGLTLRQGDPVRLAPSSPPTELPGVVGRGTAGDMSDDGTAAVVYVPDTHDVALYPGAGLPKQTLDLPDDEHVVDARFAPDGSIAVVGRRTYGLTIGNPRVPEGTANGGRSFFADLFTCHLPAGACDLTAGRAAPADIDPNPIILSR